MSEYAFIQQNSISERLNGFLKFMIALVAILLVGYFSFSVWYPFLESSSVTDNIVQFFENEVSKSTLTGVFYTHLIGGIFFVPSPDEIVYYYGLLRGENPFISMFIALLGYMLAQIVNYFCGTKMSRFILYFISKKKIYNTRRFINKYGQYGIFLFNVVPSPAPLLTLALGIAKYNFKKVFFITLLGKIVEYGIITLFFVWISR